MWIGRVKYMGGEARAESPSVQVVRRDMYGMIKPASRGRYRNHRIKMKAPLLTAVLTVSCVPETFKPTSKNWSSKIKTGAMDCNHTKSVLTRTSDGSGSSPFVYEEPEGQFLPTRMRKDWKSDHWGIPILLLVEKSTATGLTTVECNSRIVFSGSWSLAGEQEK